jgi:hypothetical protein
VPAGHDDEEQPRDLGGHDDADERPPGDGEAGGEQPWRVLDGRHGRIRAEDDQPSIASSFPYGAQLPMNLL